MLHYDAKTRTMTGELEDLTPEQVAERERRVQAGEAFTTRHPSKEKQAEVNRWYAAHRDEVRAAIRAAEEAARKDGKL